MLRLSPVLPDSLMNYAMALTPISFDVFAASTAAAMGPWVLLYVYLGTASKNIVATLSGGGEADDGGDDGSGSGGGGWLNTVLSVASIVMGISAVVYLGRVIKAAIAKAEAAGRRDGSIPPGDGGEADADDEGGGGGSEFMPLLGRALVAGGEQSVPSSSALGGRLTGGGAEMLVVARAGGAVAAIGMVDLEEKGALSSAGSFSRSRSPSVLGGGRS